MSDMVIVPSNANPGMIGAGVVALYEASKKDFEASGSEVAAVYRAMIAAAPAHPAGQVPLSDEKLEAIIAATEHGSAIFDAPALLSGRIK